VAGPAQDLERRLDATAPRLLGGKRPRRLLLLVLNGIGQAVAAIGTALLVEATFNRIVAGTGASTRELAPLAGGLTLAALAFGVLRARERVDAERLGQSYVHALRTTMYRRLSELSPRSLQTRSQGAVVLRFVGDLTAIGRWVSLGLSRLIVGVTFVVGALAALAFVSLALAGSVTVVLGLGAGVALLSARTLGSRSREARRRRARLAANVNEKVAAMGVTQVFGQTERERERVRRQSSKLRFAMVSRAQAIGRLRGLTEVTATMASVAVLMVGAREVAAGRATPGTIVAALAIVGLLVGPLRDLGRVTEYWTNARISMEKVHSFLATPNLLRISRDAPDLVAAEGRLAFVRVRLEGVLEDVTAVAEPGSLTAVVGPNGAGKSTLLALAARLLDPDEGAVLLDGQELALHSQSSIREAISMTGPDLPLLRGTVHDNLRYRNPDASPEELSRVIDLCSLAELLAELPEGAGTRVVEGGANLSAGQRQRIALARALVGDPRVLLLDEADANLDREARELVDRIVQTQRGRSTVLVVSHRPEILEWADVVWRIDGGRLTVGDAAELTHAAAPNGREP